MKTMRLLCAASLWLAAACPGWSDTYYHFATPSFTVNENDGAADITMVRTGDTNEYTDVFLFTSDGTARANRDYLYVDGYLGFEPGQTVATWKVPILNNTLKDSNRTVAVTYIDDPHGLFIDTVLTIVDDDRGVEFSAGTYSVNERDGFATITVQRRGDRTGACTADYSTTTNGTAQAGADFVPQSGTLSFAAGESNKTFTIPIRNDYHGEGDETVTLNLSNVTGDTDLGDNHRAVLTIEDDETPGGGSGGFDRWVKRSPLPTDKTLYSVGFGGNMFVAVGEAETIVTSSDGVQWNEQVSGISPWNYLSSVTWGGGLFVATGDGGVIVNSSDGVNWTQLPVTDAPYYLNGVTYGNGTFVAVGSGGGILTSTDAVHWTNRSLNLRNSLYAIAYGNGRFVAVGYGVPIVTSTDGVTWTQIEPVRDFAGVTYGAGTFVGVGGSGIATSPDGVHWTQSTNEYLAAVTYGNGRFVGFNWSEMGVSTNGMDWTFSTPVSDSLYGIAYGNGLFVTVGYYGTILTSPDGETWTRRNRSFTSQPLNDVTFANGQFVAVGGYTRFCRFCGGQDAARDAAKDLPVSDPYATILTSPDGEHWVGQTNIGALYGITSGEGFVVAVGGEEGWGSYARIAISTNATDWTGVNLTNDFPLLRAVAHGPGVFVAVGSGAVISSTGGTNWSAISNSPPGTLNDIVYGVEEFVAVGSAIATSSDGANWSSVPLPTNVFFLNSVAFGNGLFVAVGYGLHDEQYTAAILTSPDGLQWTRRDDGQFSNNLSSVTHALGTFVAVSEYALSLSSGTSREVLTSPDGIDWTRSSAVAGGSGVAGGNSTFVVVGSGGTIWQSGATLRPGFRTPAVRRLPEGAMHLVVEVEPIGAAVTLESSSDLTTWSPLVTLTNLTGVVEFTDRDAMNYPRRFYRARRQ